MPYSYSSLEDFIETLYTDIKVTAPSQLQLYSIAAALDIHVYPHRHPSRAIRFDGQQLIFLENTLSAAEQWQTFGHEMGHILMHAGNQQSMDPNFIAYQEWQADLFALHFCVPTFLLLQEDIPNDCRHATELVADTFHVTLPFAYERLQMHKQKLNDQQFHMYLWSNA